MIKRVVTFAALLLLAAQSMASAFENPTYNRPLSPSERAFVTSIQKDLMRRFPTAADAEKAGYFRYTNEDDTGAISYANLQWQSADPKHPSQLWYDKTGRLLGADFSILTVGNNRPAIFGVNPGRWYLFDDHIHYVTKDATGKREYDKYNMADKFKAAGGNPQKPTAADLVRMGKVKSASNVVKVFDAPKIWDLIVWVKPNPNGAFADKNPTVKP
jgi:hypothetical protein